LLRTTGANPTFDPNIVRGGGTAPTWDMGDGTQYTTDFVSHSYAVPGDYEVRWDMVDADLTQMAFGTDDITEIATKSTWVNLTGFGPSSNSGLGNVTMHPEWTSLLALSLNDTGATVFDFHVEWVAVTSFSLAENPGVVTCPTFSAWLLLEDLNLQNCTNFTSRRLQLICGHY